MLTADDELPLNALLGADGLLHLWIDEGSDKGVYVKCEIFDEMQALFTKREATYSRAYPRSSLCHAAITCVRCLARYDAWPAVEWQR